MARFGRTVRDSQGNTIPNATVKVYLAGTLALASIFSDADLTAPIDQATSPLVNEDDGTYEFFVSSGTYKIEVSHPSMPTETYDHVDIGVFDSFLDVQSFGAVLDGVTDDSAAVAAAVAAAASLGKILWWPSGTALFGSDVASFHDVMHRGPGAVKLGASTFRPEPGPTHVNTLYIATTGSDAASGLASTAPLLTLQKAMDVLERYGPVLGGTWQISIAAGTYADVGTMPFGLRSTNRIEIFGPDVSGGVPTVIFQSSLTIGPAAHCKLQDVKFTVSSGRSFTALGASVVWTLNVHGDGSGTGLSGIFQRSGGRLRIQGGILEGYDDGVLVYGGIDYTVGYNSGVTIKDCDNGVYARHGSWGDIETGCIIQDCTNGVNVQASARAALKAGADLRRNAIGVLSSLGGTWADLGITWNDGTADANTIRHQDRSYATELAIHSDTYGELRKSVDTAQLTHTGTTATTTLKTPWTLPANWFVDVSKKLRVKVTGTFAGAGTKTLRLQLSANLLRAISSSSGSTQNFTCEWEVWATGAAAQKIVAELAEDAIQRQEVEHGTTTVAMTSSLDVRVSGVLSDAAGSIIVETCELWITG